MGCLGIILASVLWYLTAFWLPGEMVWLWVLLWMAAIAAHKSQPTNDLLKGLGWGAFVWLWGGAFFVGDDTLAMLLVFVAGSVLNVVAEKVRAGEIVLRR